MLRILGFTLCTAVLVLQGGCTRRTPNDEVLAGQVLLRCSAAYSWVMVKAKDEVRMHNAHGWASAYYKTASESWDKDHAQKYFEARLLELKNAEDARARQVLLGQQLRDCRPSDLQQELTPSMHRALELELESLGEQPEFPVE